MRLTLMSLLFQCTRSIEMPLSPGDGPLNPIQVNCCAAQNPPKPPSSHDSFVAGGSCDRGATFAQPTVPAGAVGLEKLDAMVSADSGASADLCYDVHEYRASSWEAWVRDNDSAKFDDGTFSVAPSYSVHVPFFQSKTYHAEPISAVALLYLLRRCEHPGAPSVCASRSSCVSPAPPAGCTSCQICFYLH